MALSQASTFYGNTSHLPYASTLYPLTVGKATCNKGIVSLTGRTRVRIRSREVKSCSSKGENGAKKGLSGSSKMLLIQVAIGVFVLGFIDAGYSGDWSRIGILSKDAEQILRIASYFVVPISLWAILHLSKVNNQENS